MDATERVFPLPMLRRLRLPVRERVEISPGIVSEPEILHPDEELLERIRSADEEALLLLLKRYGRLAYTIGCRILRDEGEAEDLVQEVFLRLHAEDSTFDAAKGSARTWMVQMIYRRAFDRRAYLIRRHFYNGTDALEHANAISGAKNPEEDVIDRLTAQQLRETFGELSDKQRETLELFFFEGLTLAEIAELKGEDVKNVGHHYYRGLDRLRLAARKLMDNETNNR
jgi:RNA polymerase sigma-70 factor (ECF subfamily)